MRASRILLALPVLKTVPVFFGIIMEVISYTSVRSNLSKTIETVRLVYASIIITCKNEAPEVMIWLENYQSMRETTLLLHSPANAIHLLESI